jgi:hypothetical protein
VLKGYAADTKTIAMASASQTENAQKPFVALVMKNAVPAQHFVGGWAIENQGFGSALNIRHSEPQGNEAWVYTTPLSKGDFHILVTFNLDVMRNHEFVVEYGSLSGRTYRAVVAWEDGVMQTTFLNVEAAE